MSIIKILFLSADPSDAGRLRLGQELRDVREKLRLSKQRERFSLESREAVRPGDLTQIILEVEPQVIHFSGHGKSTGELCLEDVEGKVKTVGPDALASLFELVSEHVRCVILNACYSETQANSISQHIPFVIGMQQAIGDKAAIAFSTGFYTAIGAGRSFYDAYKFACVEIQLHDLPDHLIPILIQRKNHNLPTQSNQINSPLIRISNSRSQDVYLTEEDVKDVVIIGPRGVGKTTFIVTLTYWTSRIPRKPILSVTPMNNETFDLIHHAEDILLEVSSLEPTPILDVNSYPLYHLRIHFKPTFTLNPIKLLTKKQKFIDLRFKDYPGEIFEALVSDDKRIETDLYVDHVMKSHILLMIEGNSFQQDYVLRYGINSILKALDKHKSVQKRRIAVIASKIEQPEIWPLRARPRDFFESKFPRLKNLLDNSPAQVEYFCYSAFGVIGGKTSEPNTTFIHNSYGRDGFVLKNPLLWRPFGLLTPLYWLCTGKRNKYLDEY